MKRDQLSKCLLLYLSVAVGATQSVVLSAEEEKTDAVVWEVSDALQSHLLQRQALAEEMAEKGASPERMAEWRARNTSLAAAIRQEAKGAAGARTSGELPLSMEVRIPEGASKAMREFLLARNALLNEDAKKLNALSGGTEEERKRVFEAWRDDNSAARMELRVLAKRVAEEKVSTEIVVPQPPSIPTNVPLELRNFLSERHAFLTEQVALMDQIRTAAPEERKRMMDAWRQRSQARLQAMPTRSAPAAADAVSPVNSTKEP